MNSLSSQGVGGEKSVNEAGVATNAFQSQIIHLPLSGTDIVIETHTDGSVQISSLTMEHIKLTGLGGSHE
jgi:hypothetical protein